MIVKYPDPVLRLIAEPVTEFNEELKQIVDAMFKAMHEHGGIGLAAPQIGVSKSIFIASEKVFINIKNISYGSRTSKMVEGCLSLPGVKVEVERPTKIMFTAQDLEGKEHKYCYEGLMGRVVQHEYSHLIGKLIID